IAAHESVLDKQGQGRLVDTRRHGAWILRPLSRLQPGCLAGNRTARPVVSGCEELMKAPCLLLVCALSAETAASVDPPAAHEGHLVTRHDGKTIDVPLEHTDVKIRVAGYLADVTVTQRFRNPYANKIEAVYAFPLPTTAAVTDMTIANGARTIRGSIHERDKAKRIYEAARERGNV